MAKHRRSLTKLRWEQEHTMGNVIVSKLIQKGPDSVTVGYDLTN